MRKYREPASVIVQLVLPIVYVVAGILITDTNDFTVTQDSPISIDYTAYQSDLEAKGGTVYTYTNRTSENQ